jgi:hypothetical protein
MVVEGEHQRVRAEAADLLGEEQPILEVGGQDADIAHLLAGERAQEVRQREVVGLRGEIAELRYHVDRSVLVCQAEAQVFARRRHRLVRRFRLPVEPELLARRPDVRQVARELNDAAIPGPFLPAVQGIEFLEQDDVLEIPAEVSCRILNA